MQKSLRGDTSEASCLSLSNFTLQRQPAHLSRSRCRRHRGSASPTCFSLKATYSNFAMRPPFCSRCFKYFENLMAKEGFACTVSNIFENASGLRAIRRDGRPVMIERGLFHAFPETHGQFPASLSQPLRQALLQCEAARPGVHDRSGRAGVHGDRAQGHPEGGAPGVDRTGAR